DHTRAEMLAMVDKQWELQVPPVVDLGTAGGARVDLEVSSYQDKLATLEVPTVVLEDANIVEAMDYVRQRAIELDTLELDPLKRGVNIVLDIGGAESETGNAIRAKRFSLNLRNVPLKELVKFITESTGTIAVEQPFALVIRPAGADSTDMVVRTYRVPPDFLTSGGGAAGNDGGDVDPFAPQPDRGALPKRLTAEELLRDRGVSFPDGASANFSAGTSTLRVRNTMANHSIVEQIVDLLSNEEPTAIIVDVKMIKTTESRLKELSFDWLLGDFGFGGEGAVPGGNRGYLSGGTTGNGGNLGDIPLPLAFANNANPITAGNRSGVEAIPRNSIDELLLGSGVASFNTGRAPGVLRVNGSFSGTQVAMLMRGLDQKTGVDLAAVPSVTTRSGQAASVRVTRELIYPTEYDPPELPQQVGGGGFIDLNTGQALPEEIGIVPVTPANPTSFEMRETGIILEVLPTASADKQYVDISIKPDITEFDGFINYGTPILSGQQGVLNPTFGGLGTLLQPEDQVITPNAILMPVFSKIGTESALTVADKSTVVIGGLLEETSEEVEDKTPVLGDIPVVGRLFQSRASSPVKKAIIFLVTVRVVDGAGRPFNP
ncbi:MAG: Amuc_1098 family type IV pilus outer membrane protein, partial [Haloferula sp.]